MTSSRRPPRQRISERDIESVKHLQELYVVAIGLALTVAVERLLPSGDHGGLRLGPSALFVGFVSTLLAFYHGALRHLDDHYIFEDTRPPNAGRGVFFGDYLFLFIEGGLLIAMGATIEDPTRFLVLWSALLLLDVIWLLVLEILAKPPPGAEPDGRSWLYVNLAALALAVGLEAVETATSQVSMQTTSVVLGSICVLRTAADYAFAFGYYFPEPKTEPHGPDRHEAKQ